MNLICLKATTKWNIKRENILEERRIKGKKNEYENFSLFI